MFYNEKHFYKNDDNSDFIRKQHIQLELLVYTKVIVTKNKIEKYQGDRSCLVNLSIIFRNIVFFYFYILNTGNVFVLVIVIF